MSNGGVYTSYPTATQLTGTVGNFNLGAWALTEFWQIAYRVSYRHHSKSWGSYASKLNETPWTLYGSRVLFQYRTKTSGTWSSWQTIYTSGNSTSTTAWSTAQRVFSLQGVYDDVQVRTYAETVVVSTGIDYADTSSTPDINYNNIQDNSYVARALVR